MINNYIDPNSPLQINDEGLWLSPEQQAALSYPDEGHDACWKLEDGSFWFQHRNACILAAVQAFPPPSGGPVFDVGGGNGYVSAGLIKHGIDTVLVEPGASGARHGRERGIPHVVCATTEQAHFRPASLPAIGVFDVVEHIEDDLGFLQHLYGLLQAEGRVYVTVPAYQALWSEEDDLAGHFRRYRLPRMQSVLQQAGFEIDYASYFFRFLPLPIALLRSLPYRLGRRQGKVDLAKAQREHQSSDSGVSRLLLRALASEQGHIRAGHAMSCGGSCLLVAKKTAS